MFCEKCGSQALEGSVFCTNCGARLDSLVTETAVLEENVMEETVTEESVVEEAVTEESVVEESAQEEVLVFEEVQSQEELPVVEEVSVEAAVPVQEMPPVQAAVPVQEMPPVQGMAPVYPNNSGAYYQTTPEYAAQNAMYMQNSPDVKKGKKGGFPIVINILLGLILFLAVVLLAGILVAGNLLSQKSIASGDEQETVVSNTIPEEELLENQSTVSQVVLDGVTYTIPVETPEVSLQDQLDMEYILPDSDSIYYTKEEIDALSDEDLQLARNEIYARYGRMFKDQDIQDYFDGKSWYYGTYDPDDFDAWYGDDVLNDYELANLEIIVEIETERGL